MAKIGRPRALDEGKRREVCAFLAAGASLKQAAEYVGCSLSTLKRENQRDKEFRERTRRATATAQLIPLQAMRQAVQSHWRAAAWMLERSDPENFGRQDARHFGAKELRALRRDLLDIFNDEIEHPLLRDRIAKRVKAAIDYAMRHAWDKQRSGAKLREAMEFFDKRETSETCDGLHPTLSDPWDPMNAFVTRLREKLKDETSGVKTSRSTSAPSDETEKTKFLPFCTRPMLDDPDIAEPSEQQVGQNE